MEGLNCVELPREMVGLPLMVLIEVVVVVVVGDKGGTGGLELTEPGAGNHVG